MIRALLLTFVLTSCQSSEPEIKLSPSEYAKQKMVLLGAVGKLLQERDAKRAHTMALSLQRGRIISCVDVTKECEYFRKTMNLIIQSGRDGIADENERNEIQKASQAMIAEIKRGEKLVKEAHRKKRAK